MKQKQPACRHSHNKLFNNNPKKFLKPISKTPLKKDTKKSHDSPKKNHKLSEKSPKMITKKSKNDFNEVSK